MLGWSSRLPMTPQLGKPLPGHVPWTLPIQGSVYPLWIIREIAIFLPGLKTHEARLHGTGGPRRMPTYLGLGLQLVSCLALGREDPPSRRGRRDRRGHGARCKAVAAVPARGAGCSPGADSDSVSERGPARRAGRRLPTHPRDEGTKHSTGYSSRALNQGQSSAQPAGTAPSCLPPLAAAQRNLTVQSW